MQLGMIDASPMQTCNIILLSEQRLNSEALGGLLLAFCEADSLMVCADAQQATQQSEQEQVDLLLLDLPLRGEAWRQAIATLLRAHLDAAVVALSEGHEDLLHSPLLRERLLGVVDKGCGCDALLRLLATWRRQRQGQDCALLLLRQQLSALSPREQRVFAALGKGQLNREIAAAFGLSVATVETYRKSISGKVGISGSELVRAAVLLRCLPAA